MTSANDQAEYIDSAHEEGCQSYLVKPIRKKELLAEIESLGLTEQTESPNS